MGKVHVSFGSFAHQEWVPTLLNANATAQGKQLWFHLKGGKNEVLRPAVHDLDASLSRYQSLSIVADDIEEEIRNDVRASMARRISSLDNNDQTREVEPTVLSARSPESHPPEHVCIISESHHDSLCVLCIDRPPNFVFQQCGHLCLCSKCRTAVYLQTVRNNKQRSESKSHWNKLFSKTIECPICRTRSKAIHQSAFQGELFSC